MNDRLTILKKYPWFLYLLPAFFVLHGFTENYGFVPVKDSILLTCMYIGAGILLMLLFRIFYKNWLKAATVAFVILSFHFFFGSVQDGLRHLFPGSFLSKYLFILSASFCLFVLILVILKRKKQLHRFALYLNSLLLLLIVIDCILLAIKSMGNAGQNASLDKEFVACPQCSKPDVYVIIADEYAGSVELDAMFHFNNFAFLSELSGKGFHIIPYSSSNYNYTPYSIASTLDMDYLDLNRTAKQPLLAYTYETIGNNRFLQFLLYHGYKFYNYSLSDFKGYPSYANETFLPAKTKLITSQTFLSRVEKELRFNLVTKFRSKQEIDRTVYENRNNNEKLSRLLFQTAEQKTERHKFVLTHLMMPHYPYYYDRNGNPFPFDSIIEGNQTNRRHYIEYLEYSNKKLLGLVDQILQHATRPPIIVLFGDHGFRHFTEPVDKRNYFNNLVAIHLPGRNYSAFADSLTNVNLLRTVLNTAFDQHLPYLQDTTIIMDNP
jgi:hypothetical protein